MKSLVGRLRTGYNQFGDLYKDYELQDDLLELVKVTDSRASNSICVDVYLYKPETNELRVYFLLDLYRLGTTIPSDIVISKNPKEFAILYLAKMRHQKALEARDVAYERYAMAENEFVKRVDELEKAKRVVEDLVSNEIN